ncbi:GNAT family N-acetyltransferase [Streptomyces tubercidicus]|uniref:GNAT family N-acetyltransferase n=1 Tax=Streptomyces tubercidicus TaxID=47759 RepID=UPI0036825FAB
MNTDRDRGRDRGGHRDADTSADTATTTAAPEEPQRRTPAGTVPPLTLRPAHPTDAPVIAAIHQAARRATMPYLPQQRRTHDEVTRWIREIVLPQCHTTVAARGPELLGYAAVRGDLLEHLYLRPDARRTGIGTRLLAEAQRHRPGGLSLHVFQLNAEARAFYARHGFRVVATDDGSGNMENLPALTLHWTPAPGPLSPRGTP